MEGPPLKATTTATAPGAAATAKFTDGPVKRTRPDLGKDSPRTGLLEGINFRQRIHYITNKIKACP
jgi:hypothetical protein